jgi:hypothetical protein
MSNHSPSQSASPAVPPDPKDPTTWAPELVRTLQEIIDRSRASAGPAVIDTFDHADRRMSAVEFVRFWNATRLKAMATCGPDGAPHIAPVHAEILAGRLRSTIYEKALRRRDLRANPQVAFTTWGPNGAAAILYGIATEVPDSLRETRAGARGGTRRTVALEIEITRIYAMQGRE